METIEILRKLTSAYGVSGDEFEASNTAAELLRPFSKRVETDAMGNVTAVLNEAPKGGKTLLLDAHIDRIGLIVTQVLESGFLRVAPVGGVDRRILPAQRVNVLGKKVIPGVVISVPPHLQKAEDMKKVTSVDELLVDTGLSGGKVCEIVSPGDRIVVNSGFETLLNNCVMAGGIDDRAGVACIIKAAQDIAECQTNCGVSALFSAQEETGERGAKASSGKLFYDEVIAVDVTFAHTPDAKRHKCGELGGGVMIGIAPALSKEMSQRFRELAEEKGIKYQLEIMSGVTGTNADTLGIGNGGVKTGLLSIPIRYMHTPCEVVSVDDIESTAALIAEYIKGAEKNA